MPLFDAYAEVEALDADLGKLRRWTEQVGTRDYFRTTEVERVEQVLRQCDDALAAFTEAAYNEDTIVR